MKVTPQSRQKTDILESQDISDWLVKSSTLNQRQMGRFPHNLDFCTGDAGVGWHRPFQKGQVPPKASQGLTCRNGT